MPISLQLPCNKLQHLTRLDLSGSLVELMARSSSIGQAQALFNTTSNHHSVSTTGAAQPLINPASSGGGRYSSGAAGGGSGGSISISGSVAYGAAPSAASCQGNNFPVMLPHLRELRISMCSFSNRLFSQLASLTGLSQLQLQLKPVAQAQAHASQDTREACLVRLLQHLPDLSALSMSGYGEADLGAGIAGMQRLQAFHVVLHSKTSGGLLASLPCSLNALRLQSVQNMGSQTTGGNISVELAPLTRLSNLRQLTTWRLDWAPDALAGLPWLADLRLTMCMGSYGTSEAAALLTTLGCLTHLQRLQLRQHCFCHLPPVPAPAGGGRAGVDGDGDQRFSALTASSQLTALHLMQEADLPLPPGRAALRHMFPAGKVLPHLQELMLEGWWAQWSPRPASQYCVDAEGIDAIAASCPGLRQLVLRGVTPHGFDTSCLEQLPPAVRSVEGLIWQRG